MSKTPITGNQIREKFLSFFESKQHARVASGSLIPSNDPTLFFTNAGMVPFKDLFTGLEKRNYSRATSSQKCMRVSGKHNDLENVGRTPRHHTFFEMLGNFSFGDYFKEEAIAFAWEFLTEVLQIPKDYLWISVFREDDDAEAIWEKKMGVPKSRIIRLDEKDNFWSMGETGPCGPCSEIHVDLLMLHGKGQSAGTPATHDSDFMEIWNLVFMQFDRSADGKMTPLPKPSIDTGMGLERLATVLQKTPSNYETDLFLPLSNAISKRTGKAYGENPETDVSIRVLADHIRSTSFLISDGVMPANEGRGYVLRRIMRRAIRHGRLLGMTEPFFYEIAATLILEMKGAYPDLEKNQSYIQKVIQKEEERFLETLDKGLSMMEVEIKNLSANRKNILPGNFAFKLYDTFGFPIDLTQLIAEESKMTVDMAGFESEMGAQKQRARAAWKGSGADAIEKAYHELVASKKQSKFIGYESTQGDAKVIALLKEGKFVDSILEGEEAQVFVDQTPFYGESGGQVGDAGTIQSGSAQFEVNDTQKPLENIIAHEGTVKLGTLKVGDSVKLTVSDFARKPTMRHHTVTHILHAALREILGDHVKQAGSLVQPSRLRFDFSHFEGISKELLQKIEHRVNEVIVANYPVTKEEMTLDAAKKKGALSFFGDKYGERVRVVTVGPYSMEFCGGTHLNASGEIGLFKILSESSVASGVRRIEAVAGLAALDYVQQQERAQSEVASLLKAAPQEVPAKIKSQSDRLKELEREVAQLKRKLASGGTGADPMQQVKDVNGTRLLAMEVDLEDPKAIREFADTLKPKLGTGVLVLAAKSEGKVSLFVSVSKDLTEKFQAGKLIAELAPIVGGKGGGRPDMAQAGGNMPEKIPAVFEKVMQLL